MVLVNSYKVDGIEKSMSGTLPGSMGDVLHISQQGPGGE